MDEYTKTHLWGFLFALIIVIGVYVLFFHQNLFPGPCVDVCKNIHNYNWSFDDIQDVCPMNRNQYECCKKGGYNWRGSYPYVTCGGMKSDEEIIAENIAKCEQAYALIGKDVDCEELMT